MSSSRTSASHPGSTHRARLLELLATVPDPRDPRGIRHPAGMLLAVGIAAVLAGSRSYAAIGEWVIDQPPGALEDLGVSDESRPEKSCLRRLFAGSTQTPWTGSSGRGCSPVPPYGTGGG